MRWLLLDEVVSVQRGTRATTRSHVPAGWASPELLMVEMMAQTGALLVGAENDYREDLIFAKIEDAQFDRGYRSGESIRIEAESESLRDEGAWLDGRIHNDAGLVARARFLLMNVGRLIPGQTKPITFHEAFMNHFKIREKVR